MNHMVFLPHFFLTLFSNKSLILWPLKTKITFDKNYFQTDDIIFERNFFPGPTDQNTSKFFKTTIFLLVTAR
jgi:hypothetical protein